VLVALPLAFHQTRLITRSRLVREGGGRRTNRVKGLVGGRRQRSESCMVGVLPYVCRLRVCRAPIGTLKVCCLNGLFHPASSLSIATSSSPLPRTEHGSLHGTALRWSSPDGEPPHARRVRRDRWDDADSDSALPAAVVRGLSLLVRGAYGHKRSPVRNGRNVRLAGGVDAADGGGPPMSPLN